MGSFEVAGRETRGGLGQTPGDRENKPARGNRARRVSLPPLGYRPRGALILAEWQTLVEAGAPSDEMSGASMVGQTNARKRCFDSDWRQSRNRGEGLRGSSQRLGSICSRRGQTPTVLHKSRQGAVSVPCDMGADKEGSYLGRPARHQGKAHPRSRAVRVHEDGAAREFP
jgi:hypothetical protein